MAFYKSKFTGQEIDARLAQGTYDDAVKAGFKGTKEEFYALLGQLQETTDAATISQPAESDKLETFNKNIVDAINELHQELQAKPDEQDVIDQGELEVFKDEIAAKYATKGEIEGDIKDLNSKISTLNTNLVESVDTINKNVNDGFTVINQALTETNNTLIAEIDQRKEADKDVLAKVKEGDTKLQKDLQTLNQNVVQSINQINENVANGFNTINGAINDELRPNIENNKTNITQLQETVAIVNTNLYESIETINTALNNAVNTINGGIATEISDRQNADTELDSKITKEISDRTAAIVSLDSTLRNEITQRKNADITLDSMIRQEMSNRQTADDQLSERIETLENAGYQNADQVKAEIEKIIDAAPEALDTLKEISDALNNDPDFATTITTELSKKLDSDKLLAGAGINVREEYGKKIVDISDDTLTKIQYADSEVRRLETAKIPYAYDEKTQSNINIILPEGGSYLGNYGDDNATIAKAAVYDGRKQLEIGSSKVHTNINTDSDVTIETSSGKKIIATTDQIPDTSNFVTTEALDTKADKTELENVVKYTDISDADDTPRKTIMLDNNDTLSAYNTTGTANNIAMISKWDVVDLGSTSLPINLNGSKERPTYNDSKELALVSDIPNMSEYATTTELETKVDKVEGKQLSTEDYTTEEKEKLSKVNPDLISIAVNFPIRTSGGSDGTEDRVYTQEEILEWFGVADIAALKKQIANKGIQYVKYGIMLMGNPYYYKMPIEYIAFESANQIKLIFIGLNTNNDVVSKYEIIINLDGTIIEGNSNVKVTISNIEPEAYDDTQLRNELQQTETGVATANSEIEKLKSGKQSIQDEALQTTNKTVVGAINELLAKIQELETKNTELESRLAALEGTN